MFDIQDYLALRRYDPQDTVNGAEDWVTEIIEIETQLNQQADADDALESDSESESDSSSAS